MSRGDDKFSKMQWSFSRLNSFGSCKYAWLLKYLKDEDDEPDEPDVPMFFANFGSFIHNLLAQYLSGNLSAHDVPTEYLLNYLTEVQGRAPSSKVRSNYFQDGLAFVNSLPPNIENADVLAVENEVHYKVGNYPFVGFVDLVVKTPSGLMVVDHKSRVLKPISGKSPPLKSDMETLSYAKQLYLYAIPVAEQFGCYPDYLCFNCFRKREIIKLKFDIAQFEAAKQWALDTIQQIQAEKEWRPTLDFFHCTYLCEKHNACVYYNTNWGNRRE